MRPFLISSVYRNEGGIIRTLGHVDDILQEVFVRVHRQIDSVKDPQRLVSWVYQITRNAITDHYRKPGRQREVPAGLSSKLEALHEFQASLEMVHQSGVIEPRAELAGCLRPLLERLSQDSRDAIRLVEFEGLTQQDAAKQMGISLSGMKSRVQRGRKKLKQILDDCCRIELDRRGGVVAYHPHRTDGGCLLRPKERVNDGQDMSLDRDVGAYPLSANMPRQVVDRTYSNG